MTPQEKQRETRRKNREAQEKKRADQRAEQELIRSNLKAILESEDATPAEKLESSKLLLEMNKRK